MGQDKPVIPGQLFDLVSSHQWEICITCLAHHQLYSYIHVHIIVHQYMYIHVHVCILLWGSYSIYMYMYMYILYEPHKRIHTCTCTSSHEHHSTLCTCTPQVGQLLEDQIISTERIRRRLKPSLLPEIIDETAQEVHTLHVCMNSPIYQIQTITLCELSQLSCLSSSVVEYHAEVMGSNPT